MEILSSKTIIFATEEAPIVGGHGGGSQVSAWILSQFLERGYKVRILCVDPASSMGGETIEIRRAECIKVLMAAGVSEVRFISQIPLNDFLIPPGSGFLSCLFNGARYRQVARSRKLAIRRSAAIALEEMEGDLCFVFSHFLFHMAGCKKRLPTICLLPHTGEPFIELGVRAGSRKILGSNVLASLLLPLLHILHHRQLQGLSNQIDLGIVTVNYYLNIWKKIKHKNLQLVYLAQFTSDEADDLSTTGVPTIKNQPPYRIALVGHLRGNLTKAGLIYFGEHILPALERRGILENFSFDIIGKFEPEPDIAKRLQYPNIRFRGFIENLADEIQMADVVLAPIPIAPGAGMRLSTLSSLSSCIVTHRAVGSSHDQYVDGQNCLMAESGDEFVDALVSGCSDVDLNRKLRAGARNTYESNFTPKAFFDTLEVLIQKKLVSNSEEMSFDSSVNINKTNSAQ